MQRQCYTWVGDDGGHRLGYVVYASGARYLMQHRQNPHEHEWVSMWRVTAYPAAPIEEPTR